VISWADHYFASYASKLWF